MTNCTLRAGYITWMVPAQWQTIVQFDTFIYENAEWIFQSINIKELNTVLLFKTFEIKVLES